MKLILLSTLLSFSVHWLTALELPLIFTDHMVLQREIDAPVWGRAVPGTQVQVRLLDQTLITKADAGGRWQVVFKGLPTWKVGTTLVVTNGNEQVTINDVLIGEVWLASGQSNMAHPLEKTTDGVEEAAQQRDPLLRLHAVGVTPEFTPQWNATGINFLFKRHSQWYGIADRQTGHFGSTPYYFAKELRRLLGDVPVGILQCAVGGRAIQNFCSRETLAKNDLGRRQLKALDESIADWDSGQLEREYPAQLEAWQASGADIKLKPRKPVDPRIDSWMPASLYNGMIHPQIPYGFRGAIWYQGESNVKPSEEPRYYADTLANMITDWRKSFGHEFTFLIVQLAGFRDPLQEPQPVNFDLMQYGWPFVQDQQRLVSHRVARTGLVVTNDIGEAENIHPGNKLDVGRRLARWAMHFDYGAKRVPSGPIFKKAAFNQSQVTLSFDYAAGLKTRDGKTPGHFDLAGVDGKIYWADARIEGETVVVSSHSVPFPVQVRYAWASQPANANLVNDEGLPASCFIATTSDPLGKGETLSSQ